MTRDELLSRFPNASPGFIAANLGDPRPAPQLEHRAGPKPLAADQAQAPGSSRVHCRIVSVRKRLLDPDNLCEKWLVDALRYVGAIPGDEPACLTLETTQRQAQKGEAEQTEVTIF